MPAKKYETVDGYLADVPEAQRPTVEKLRMTIKAAIPEAEEVISYNMPAYRHNGVLLYFGVFAKHIGLYPTPSGIKAFEDKMEGFQYAKGSVKFPFDQEMPWELVKEIAQFRLNERKSKK